MFTPSRTHTPVGTGSGRRRSAAPFNLTPRRSQASGQRTRRPHFFPRSSPADSSVIGSPSISAVFNTANYVVDNSGSSLPVLVSEAITLKGESLNISVEFSENGWAWLVCERKLFVWRFKQGVSKHLCKEFSLPSLGSAESSHHASLVYVGKSPEARDDGIVSLMLVTTKGSVKFWPNIVQNISSTLETNLEGIAANSAEEECLKVEPTHGNSYLVATTKGALYHLLPSSSSVTCTRLQVSHGMLAGIGRRVSSFFFSATQDVNVVNFITLQTSSRSAPEVVLLTSTAIQKWRLVSIGPGSGSDHMAAQADLNSLLCEPISQEVWSVARKDFKIWPLDVCLSSKHNHVAVLIAVADDSARRETELRFIICICPPSILKEGQDPATSSSSVEIFLLDHTEIMVNEYDCAGFSYRLVIPDASTSAPEQAIIWRENSVIIKSLSKGSQQHEDGLPLDSTGDSVLGAGRHGSRCILLATSSGLLTINPVVSSRSLVSQNIEDSILQTPSSSRPQTPLSSLPSTPVVSKAKIEQLEASDNGSQRLQAAFIHFNRMNIAQAKSIVEDAFGGTEGRRSLDDAAVFVSHELIDDYPAQDPRWAESVPQDSGNATTSLILLHQLQDKQKAHQLFLDFLNEVGIWDALGVAVNSKTKQKTSSQWLLVEHGEKLTASIALRQKHAEHQGVVDAAIRKVLERRDRIFDKRGLTPQDVFYREVSRIQDILEGLLDTEEDMIGSSALSSREIFTAIAGVNEIFEAMLSSAHQYRRSKNLSVQDKEIEYSPWTVSSGRHSIREATVRQHDITFSRGLPEAEDGQQRAVLHSHLVSLADIVLSGYMLQMESVSNSSSLSARHDEITVSFKKHRNMMITPIMDAGLIDKAAILAEKYHDFGVLVQICDRKNDQERLSQYITEFSSQGFSDFLFNWYLEQGMYRKLLDCASSNAIATADYNERLAEFLTSHPKIAWLHQIRTGDFMSAHRTLQYLAEMEKRSAVKKCNLLSLSKLSAVFSDEDDEEIEQRVECINSEQILLRYQESLPNAVLEKLGVTLDNMPVFRAEKLIELYVGDENASSNEVDFKKSLDLLQFLQEMPPEEMDDEMQEDAPDVKELKDYIWCRAILKDHWEGIDHAGNPLEACNHTILSKTLNLAHDSGTLTECFPDVERLLEQEELGTIRESASSQYLIRAKFEQFHRRLISS